MRRSIKDKLKVKKVTLKLFILSC